MRYVRNGYGRFVAGTVGGWGTGTLPAANPN